LSKAADIELVIPQVVKGYLPAGCWLVYRYQPNIWHIKPGIMAVWFGTRQIFFVDAASFVIAGILILTLPGSLMRSQPTQIKQFSTWQDVLKGVRLLFGDKLIRFALSIEFVSAIAGAQILVNTVGHIKSGLHLNDQHYGWVMAAFGVGLPLLHLFPVLSINPNQEKHLY
jgi:hypothetical protein